MIHFEFQASSSTEAFAPILIRRTGNGWRSGRQQPAGDEGPLPAETYRERSASLHQGVCDLPHLPLARHHSQQGDAIVLPAVHDMPFPMLRTDHQDGFPGRHWKTIRFEGETVEDFIMIFILNKIHLFRRYPAVLAFHFKWHLPEKVILFICAEST